MMKIAIGGAKLSLAKGKKMPQDKIWVAHYMEDAFRVLAELIIDDQIPPAQVTNHVNYLLQIACFAQTMKLRSILNYDTNYHWEQNANSFMLGLHELRPHACPS